MSEYTNKAQQRILHIIEVLAGNELEGLPLKEVAKEADQSIHSAYRDLKNLEDAGWAEQRENTHWRLTPRAAAPLRKIQENIHSLMGQVNRINREYMTSSIGAE